MPQCTGQKKAVKARNNSDPVHEGAALHRMNSKRVMLYCFIPWSVHSSVFVIGSNRGILCDVSTNRIFWMQQSQATVGQRVRQGKVVPRGMYSVKVSGDKVTNVVR